MKLTRRQPEPCVHPAPSIDLLVDRGAYAPWYMTQRLDQEAARARRYGCPLTLLAATPLLLAGEELTERALASAVGAARRAARECDLIGWSDDGRLLLLMPETPASDAHVAATRLRDDMYLQSRAHGGQKWIVAILDEVGDFADVRRVAEALREKFELERARNAA